MIEKESWNWSSNPDGLSVTKYSRKRIYQKPRVDYEKKQNSLGLKYACHNTRKKIQNGFVEY